VFSEAEFDRPPPSRNAADHTIELFPNAKPHRSKIYAVPRAYQPELQKFIAENLCTGCIQPSSSPWAAPLFFKDEGNKLRPLIDYRALNEVTKKDAHPLPLIKTILDNLPGSRIFTKMDVRKGYNNIKIREGDEPLTAFICPLGQYEYTVMGFGLTNAPASFQRFMNAILQDELATGHVHVYIDDILIHTKDIDQHRDLTHQVLKKLSDNQLTVQPSKCAFEQEEVEFLGQIIGHGRMQQSNKKCQGIRDWPTPRCKRDLQRFLGLINYYRRYIPRLSELAAPLHPLTGKEEWTWDKVKEDAFSALKMAFLNSCETAIPTDEGAWKLETDASDIAIGAILSQQQDDGSWKMVDCLSKSLSPAEKNYDAYDKEMLAII
jgi:hypothetical protein